MTSTKTPREELEALVGKPILSRVAFDASPAHKRTVKDWLTKSGWDPSGANEFTDDVLWYWAPSALDKFYVVETDE